MREKEERKGRESGRENEREGERRINIPPPEIESVTSPVGYCPAVPPTVPPTAVTQGEPEGKSGEKRPEAVQFPPTPLLK